MRSSLQNLVCCIVLMSALFGHNLFFIIGTEQIALCLGDNLVQEAPLQWQCQQRYDITMYSYDVNSGAIACSGTI
ncbi:hypothetical protein MtrunA17_Chr2g0299281 [Medicago truncatula]|uniref:Uncharacterized protein n=1 Tax=Medicago truncatula TaxID=3880 RepID=A0A396J844_MEDTR|nr:hypothetical protein MtrunA17_Chr2g0299281 [Medicago truncatula]